MPPKAKTNWYLWGKMLVAGGICCIGGPALTFWLTPTEEELFKKYNPDLQRRSLENRISKKGERDFDEFVGRLKEFSKSDKPIWEVAAEAEKKEREGKILEQVKLSKEIQQRKEEIRKSG
ncbi:hypothetical protein B0O99DRAFT_616820 [Bisporella sp. PMI_857]|nr:hypothetical protein B0O99DRAFT_616820 [Bisporella sp. PMI_857]